MTRLNCGDFEINRCLCLGLQLCGDGRQDAKKHYFRMLKSQPDANSMDRSPRAARGNNTGREEV
jgi:hypothetical protein